MDLHLKGKKAIVLGGTRGIGRAIAETFAAEGADVAICARNADQVKDSVAALKDKGVRATGASVDIADGAALKSWIEKAAGELGGIDILVSNAGAMAQGPGEADWNLNFMIISSVSAAESDNASSYGPIKAALIHMAKGLARQHAKRGIRTNVVSPGTVYFKGGVWATVEANAPAYFKQAIERNPTGRMATPQEIANATVFLASPVSSFTTGVNLLVDGAISRRVNF